MQASRYVRVVQGVRYSYLFSKFLGFYTHLIPSSVIALHQFVGEYQHKLSLFSTILDVWVRVQRTWMDLETIFSAGDIQRQLPLESKLFHEVDKNYTGIIFSIPMPLLYPSLLFPSRVLLLCQIYPCTSSIILCPHLSLLCLCTPAYLPDCPSFLILFLLALMKKTAVSTNVLSIALKVRTYTLPSLLSDFFNFHTPSSSLSIPNISTFLYFSIRCFFGVPATLMKSDWK